MATCAVVLLSSCGAPQEDTSSSAYCRLARRHDDARRTWEPFDRTSTLLYVVALLDVAEDAEAVAPAEIDHEFRVLAAEYREMAAIAEASRYNVDRMGTGDRARFLEPRGEVALAAAAVAAYDRRACGIGPRTRSSRGASARGSIRGSLS